MGTCWEILKTKMERQIVDSRRCGWTIIQSEVSQTEKQILYINPYNVDSRKWYRSSHLQSRNGDTDIKIKHVDTNSEGGWRVG